MKKYQTIIVERKGAIGYLTLNRPSKMNALSPTLLAETEDACKDFADDPEIKVFIIKGAGRAFSAGYDMYEENLPTSSVELWGQTSDIWWRCLWDNPKITIAQVHSFCLAGGGEICCYCDMVFCSEDALFGYPPVRYASVGAGLFWPTHLGLHKAMQYLTTGNMMTAQEAYRVGFVNEVFTREQLEPAVEKLAKTIAKLPMWALRINKKGVHEWYELMGLRTAIRFNHQLAMISYGSPPESIPHGYQDITRVTKEKGMRAAFEYMNQDFLEEDSIARSQMARPDRKA